MANMANNESLYQLNDDELLRYSRQVLLSGWDIDAQLKLKSARVVLIGAGGLGCPASETLVRAGVGFVHLIDDDKIEMSNLQRQTLFLPKDIGESKALTAAKMLNDINPLIRAFGSTERLRDDNAFEVLTRFSGEMPDLLLDCSDNFATRDMSNWLSIRYQLPLLSASAIGFQGQLALFEPSQHNGCYQCIFGDTTSHDEQNCANSGVLASTTAIMGNLQANLALQYLGLGNHPLANKLLLWDGLRMQQRVIGYKKDECCKACGQ